MIQLRAFMGTWPQRGHALNVLADDEGVDRLRAEGQTEELSERLLPEGRHTGSVRALSGLAQEALEMLVA